jgi:hypothetical protein
MNKLTNFLLLLLGAGLLGSTLWQVLLNMGKVAPLSQTGYVPDMVWSLPLVTAARVDLFGYVLASAAVYAAMLFVGFGEEEEGGGKGGSAKKKKSGLTCVLGDLKWDRNSFCRGWLVTGGTGSGKTQCAINIVMHQIFQNETGTLAEGWDRNKLKQKEAELYENYNKGVEKPKSEADAVQKELREFKAALFLAREDHTAEEIDASIREFQQPDGDSDGEPAQVAAAEPAPQESPAAESAPPARRSITDLGNEVRDQLEASLLNLEANEDTIGDAFATEQERLQARNEKQEGQVEQQGKDRLMTMEEVNRIEDTAMRRKELERQVAMRQLRVDELLGSFEERRMSLTRAMAKIEQTKFVEYPWGGICVDEKGLYWQTLVEMAAHYGREHHLCLLQTRPDWAPSTWKPVARLNLLSDHRIPANTYSNAIVETANTIGGGDGDKGFFKTQAESNIGWAIEFFRQVGYAQKESGWCEKTGNEPLEPDLKSILNFLSQSKEKLDTTLGNYGIFVKRPASEGGQKSLAGGRRIHKEESDEDKNPAVFSGVQQRNGQWCFSADNYPKLVEAIDHFRNRYWSQPKDQLGGVQGTIYNYLVYFQHEEIADVFCNGNTFDFDDIEKGRIVCVAMPQKFQIERRYVCTMLKLLYYQLVLRRFDKSPEEFKRKNLLVAWQDEAQRFVTKHDGNVDVIREAGATTFMATQSKSSLLPPLGGKEKAEPIILNLRNRMIFKAADDICAQGSAEFLGKHEYKKKSYTQNKPMQGFKSINESKEEAFLVKPFQFREMKDFTAFVCHAEGQYIKYTIAPKTTDNKFPFWWPIAVRKQKMWRILLWIKLGRWQEFTKQKVRIPK